VVISDRPMEDDINRVVRALTDIIAAEQVAPDMMRVITVSNEHIVDTRCERSTCFDMQYNIQREDRCKHLWRVFLGRSRLPVNPIFGIDN
jgi:hypothetical protein